MIFVDPPHLAGPQMDLSGDPQNQREHPKVTAMRPLVTNGSEKPVLLFSRCGAAAGASAARQGGMCRPADTGADPG